MSNFKEQVMQLLVGIRNVSFIKRSCCELDSVCGFPLRQGVLLVAVSTIVSIRSFCIRISLNILPSLQ